MWTFGSIETLVLGGVHLVAAAYVTAHVLLNKRDVGASISWIGLAWLSPIVGSVLYALFGVNRVQARAVSLRESQSRRSVEHVYGAAQIKDSHLAPLERAIDQITGRPLEGGNKVALFRNGDEAYPRMIAAINAAQTSVALSTYIFRLDHIGNAFIEALIQAHTRGVEVRVIVDGVGGGYLVSSAHAKLQNNSVPCARFLHSPLPWRMPFLNLRTHKKLLTVDGVLAFAGGLNIGDENCLLENPPSPVRDTHFLFEGPVVGQLNDLFGEDWLFLTGEKLDGDRWFPAASDIGTAIARAIASGPDQDIEKIETVILQAIACARVSIKVATPYFLCDERLVSSLILASMRGINVVVIVPETNNHRIMDWAARPQVRRLVEVGCQVWKNPRPFDHSKIMTIDGTWALIGSANWDRRSFRLNFELNVEIYHTDLIQQIDACLKEKQGRLVTAAEARSDAIPKRLRDNAARLLLPYL